MKKIGLVVAIEMDSVFDYYAEIEKLEAPKGYEIYHCKKGENEIYVIRTGMGEVAAAAGTQYLITKYGVEAIVNFGVVGGLTEEMGKCRLCVVKRAVHYHYDCSEFMDLKIGQVDGRDSIFLPTDETLLKRAMAVRPDLVPVTCCSADKFISTPEEKRELHERFEGDICEMESAGIVLTCDANDIPCLLLKAVSDSLCGGAGEFYKELYAASMECLRMVDEVLGAL